MHLAIYFKPESMNKVQFDEITRRLETAGQSRPTGRLYHVSFGSENNLNVFDIWDSLKNFESFGRILMPILKQVGVNPGEPEIKEVHKIIEG